jgi:sugar phosphate isomerase/epimerase
MNRLAIITAFLGGVKNRYMTYQGDRALQQKLEMASRVEGIDGLELCYPADFGDPAELRSLLGRYGFGVSAINFRSRRTGKWWRGSFTSEDERERAEVVDDLKRAMDYAGKLGCKRITTCPTMRWRPCPLPVRTTGRCGSA